MKRLISIFASMVLVASASAQTYYTKYFNDKALVEKATAWKADTQAWGGVFTKAKPHKSVNATDFYLQYQKNKAEWDKLFKWLQETDLLTIPKGKMKLEGTDITISIEDSKNEPLEKRKTESHHHNCDFMLVVKGIERFGVLDHFSSTTTGQWKPDVIRYEYDNSKTRFYDSRPDEFFIFFPNDWHIAKIANDTKDQNIRVIVAKVKYVE